MPAKTTKAAPAKVAAKTTPKKAPANKPVSKKTPQPKAQIKPKEPVLNPRELCKLKGEWPRGVFCQDTFDEICTRLSRGEPLQPICRDAGMPSFDTVYKWLHASLERQQAFARAREVGEEAIASETLEIADDGRNDWMEKLDSEGMPIGWALNGEHVQRSKLRIETRLKLLAKWNPKKWGEKIQVDGEIKTTPDQVQNQLLATLTALQAKQGNDNSSD